MKHLSRTIHFDSAVFIKAAISEYDDDVSMHVVEFAVTDEWTLSFSDLKEDEDPNFIHYQLKCWLGLGKRIINNGETTFHISLHLIYMSEISLPKMWSNSMRSSDNKSGMTLGQH